jgi:hypothetical protein
VVDADSTRIGAGEKCIQNFDRKPEEEFNIKIKEVNTEMEPATVAERSKA